MRPVRYLLAMSLDGFIAGPNGETDWIIPDPSVDFRDIFAQCDTVLMGRRTYEMTLTPGAPPWPDGWRIYVFSRSLKASDHPAVTVVNDDSAAVVRQLREESGRDIWLFGGANLFATLRAAGVVDRIELSVMPVILGQGLPLAGGTALRSDLALLRSNASEAGILHVSYTFRSLERQ